VNLREINSNEISDNKIWNSTHTKIIGLKIGQFLFKVIYGTYKTRKFRANTSSPERMWCLTCDKEESMCHILTECRAPTREVP
jgi:hypothetical protein